MMPGPHAAPCLLRDPRLRAHAVVKRFPILPAHPERVCWGCDRYCPADAMACGNGSERSPHPSELFGPDWHDWVPPTASPAPSAAPLVPAPRRKNTP